MKSKPKTILGKIYDAAINIPPNDKELLFFHDEVFAWSLGIYDNKLKKYISKWNTPVLYWTLVPPRSLLFLKRCSSVFKPLNFS